MSTPYMIDKNHRVARHKNGHLVIEYVPDYVPSVEATDKAFRSLAKAWPVLSEHASHIDGEFDNALTDLRRMVEALRERLAEQSAPALQFQTSEQYPLRSDVVQHIASIWSLADVPEGHPMYFARYTIQRLCASHLALQANVDKPREDQSRATDATP